MSERFTVDELAGRFLAAFGRVATVLARAPGRVNLIGEHTDYNDGFVMPAAIEQETRIAAAPREDRQVHLLALDLERETQFELDDIAPSADEPWSNYLRGVAAGLRAAGYPLRGMDAVIQSSVPIGAGLSSSAALELAAVEAFSGVSDFHVPRQEAARIGQQAEHTFVGMMCGLMDQLASAMGRADHLLLIDCRHLTHKLVALPARSTLLIADTGARRELARSAYNRRRAQSEAAARALGVRALRDATPAMLEAADLEPVLLRRARHVISENARVLDMAHALRTGDLEAAGRLLYASHVSLRDLYEVSSPELDALVDVLRAQPGCYGARLTGAGFGGCTIALMRSDAVADAMPAVTAAYKRRTGLDAHLYPGRPSAGASRIALPG
jgi:galactokinase